MRLFIAEKPSLARAIVEVLPRPHIKDGDCVRCGDSDIVAWCVGHILELAPPDQYNPSFKQWDIESLPIIPGSWKHLVSNPKIYKGLSGLIKQANIIVNAGDPDREGQLLVDEVIERVGTKALIQRILINDLNPAAVKKALSAIDDNSNYKGLSDSALARGRADWLYGLNMTRLYTLLGRAGGYDGVLSVGRVQTPLLGLIVRRDREIASFVAKPFYTMIADFQAGGSFFGNWKAGESAKPYLDEEGRLVDEVYANNLAALLRNKDGFIESVEKKDKKKLPPLPFSLNGIQVAAAKRYDYSAQEVLDACQGLYETYKLTTYPRSDCSYLPEEHLGDARVVIESVIANSEACRVLAAGANSVLRSKAWDDSKVTAHHAIIPTSTRDDISRLTVVESNIYNLICERYLIQFYPNHEYKETKIDVRVGGELFTKTGKIVTQTGWIGAINSAEEDGEKESRLPDVAENEKVVCKIVTVQNKTTTAPKPFTNESIVAAMSGISKFVTNPKIKALLKDSDGIGTPATQSQIIETLYLRQYIVKRGKSIVSTELGQFLVSVLPDVATTPDMTAFWESAMSRISSNEMPLNQFLSGIEKQLTKLIAGGVEQKKLVIPGLVLHSCPSDACDGNFSRKKGVNGHFWGCDNYKTGCKETRPDKRGQPDWNPKIKKGGVKKTRKVRRSRGRKTN